MGSSHLINHYQTNDELGRLSRQSQSIEFITTIRVLDEMLPKGCAVLDLGSGPGRYALHFAQQGHMVTAVDPVPKHIEQLHAQADRGDCSGRIRAFLGDHGTLDQWKPESYDAVLCMGPIYHLTEVDERRRCVAACVRVLKRGGLAAFAYINKYFALPFQVLQDRKFLDREYMRRLLDCGTVASTDRYCGWTDCHYCMPEEVEGLALEAGLHIDAHIATDGIGILLRDMVDAFDKEQFAVWVDYHLKTCREPSLLGYSNHGLLICWKA